jgi:NADPH-dependent 2,4-dienoyl-CoA reductase/sulfur reductase-like enzyme
VRSEPLPPDASVVVVGGGLAGLRAAEALRREGHRGRLVLVGDEPHLPYDRPPLSKQLLAGRFGPERTWLRPHDRFEALGIELRLATPAVGLDVDGPSVNLADGSRIDAQGVVLAPGARPRRLGSSEAFVLRTLDDALALRRALEAHRPARVVVVGGGFIGAEVAATARVAHGAEVVVVEALEEPMAHALGTQVGAACRRLHEAHGVEVLTRAWVERVERVPSGALAVVLMDGRRLVADVVVVGIGVVPTTGFLEGSGLGLDDGVVVDDRLFAAPRVVAAGDAARVVDPVTGEGRRVEHWTNAAEQGDLAGANLLAGSLEARRYDPVHYVWSDQYDAKLQLLGIPSPDDELVVGYGSLEADRFVALYGRNGRLAAVLGMRCPRQVMGLRRFLEQHSGLGEALQALGDLAENAAENASPA